MKKTWDSFSLAQGTDISHLRFSEMTKYALEAVTGYNERFNDTYMQLSQPYYAGYGTRPVGTLQPYGVGAH